MSRERVLRLSPVAASALTMLFVGAAYSQNTSSNPHGVPNPYRTIENHFKLPNGRSLGATSGVDIDRDGVSVWVFERCGARECAGSPLTPVLKFDQSGTLVTSFGAGTFVEPHGIHVDRQGNIWLTDVREKAGRGHQVFKFSPSGELLMTLGRPGVAGDGPDTFNGPSDVVTAANGSIFVADGHWSGATPRIVKFSPDGTFIKSWGKRGAAPGEFELPHALAMDSVGRLFVGDHGNRRVQVFDQEGGFIAEWKQFGRPAGLYIDQHDTLYSASRSTQKMDPGWQGGIVIGNAKNGEVFAFIPDPDPNGPQEAVATDVNGNIYGGLTDSGNDPESIARGRAVKKYVKK